MEVAVRVRKCSSPLGAVLLERSMKSNHANFLKKTLPFAPRYSVDELVRAGPALMKETIVCLSCALSIPLLPPQP